MNEGGDSGNMDSRAQRYCGKYLDVSEGSTRNGQVTCKCEPKCLICYQNSTHLFLISATSVPFDLFVFSDASSVTADKSSATGHF